MFIVQNVFLINMYVRSDAAGPMDLGIIHSCINHCPPSAGTPSPETPSITAAWKNCPGFWKRDRDGLLVWRWHCACFT